MSTWHDKLHVYLTWLHRNENSKQASCDDPNWIRFDYKSDIRENEIQASRSYEHERFETRICDQNSAGVHTEKSFRNLIKSNRNQILFTIFWLIWYQKDVSLVPNQSVHGKYNLISVWFHKISKRFLCVYSFSITAYTKKKTVLDQFWFLFYWRTLTEYLRKTIPACFRRQ